MKDADSLVDENTALNPVSLYAETKVNSELFLLDQSRDNTCKPVCMRFATVYGLSSRMRFDLTVNEFTKELALQRKLVVYGEQFWRPYCHVSDISAAVSMILDAPDEKVAFEVFNVGSTNENYTKQMLVDEISKRIKNPDVEYVRKEEDPRDYKVNFNKINSVLGFNTLMDVPSGIVQVKQAVEQGIISQPDSEVFRNS
jgi:nucleoside-diphosphate-sugar epimerase